MLNVSAPFVSQISAHHTQKRLTLIGDEIALRNGRIHEVLGPAADMFVLAAAARTNADMLWIGLRRDTETLCPTGLQSFIDPESLLIIEGVSRGELLWAAEQALRAEGSFTVILEMPDAVSLHESRRLQLAAEEGGGLGLVILHGPARTSAAQTRWACKPIAGERPAWVWSCIKGKHGEMGCWHSQWMGKRNGEDALHLAAAAAA